MRKLALLGMTVVFAVSITGAAEGANGRFALMIGNGVGPTDGDICTTAATCDWGDDGTAPGNFDLPEDIAVDSTGNAYVADTENNRIQVFAPDGTFRSAWGKDVVAGNGSTDYEICAPLNGDTCKAGVSGPAGGEMGRPVGIAVAPGVAGLDEVYVSDQSNRRVMRFTRTGSFLRAWGKDVTASGPGDTGTGFEICSSTAGDTCKSGAQGDLGGEFFLPGGIAVAPDHDLIFVMDPGNGRVQSFAQLSGAFNRTWGENVDSVAPGTGPEICTVAANCQEATNTGDGLGGTFSLAYHVAVDENSSVYVTDNNWDRVSKYTINGGFIRAWGADIVEGDGDNGLEVCVAAQGDTCQAPLPIHQPAPRDQGEFYVPAGIAADADNNIYVGASQMVLKFTETGQFLREWGYDVVESGPNNTADGNREICVNGVDLCTGAFDVTTGFAGGEFSAPRGIETGPGGVLWTTESNAHRVQKFSDEVTGGSGSGQPATIAPPAQTRNPRAEALLKCKKKPKLKRKKCRKKAKKLPTEAPPTDIPR